MAITPAMFQFKPFSKKQLQLLTWWTDKSPVKDKDGIIVDGAIRSGKTLPMSLSFVMWAMARFNGQQFGMCGKTIGAFRRNVLFLLKIMLRSRGYKVIDQRGDNLVTIRRGSVENYFYIFGGKDERSQDLIQGVTLAGVFFDEVALMPESFVNQATGRCSVEGAKLWFNCNPEGPRHWFRSEWLLKYAEKNLLYLHFEMDDNPSLSEETKAKYRKRYTGVFYLRYILGLWAKAEGLIYSLFANDEARFAIKCEDVPKLAYINIGVDFGGNKSNHAFVATGIDKDYYCLYALAAKSSPAKGKDASTLLREFMEFAEYIEAVYGDIDRVYPDSAEQVLVNTLAQKTPYRVLNSVKETIIDRIRCAVLLFGDDRIRLVEGDCEDLANGLRNAVWDDDKDEDVRLDDGTSDIDVLDAWEYSWSDYIIRILRGQRDDNDDN